MQIRLGIAMITEGISSYMHGEAMAPIVMQDNAGQGDGEFSMDRRINALQGEQDTAKAGVAVSRKGIRTSDVRAGYGASQFTGNVATGEVATASTAPTGDVNYEDEIDEALDYADELAPIVDVSDDAEVIDDVSDASTVGRLGTTFDASL
jgi:hypothetical protein